jgi:hypothetical protein
MDKNWKGRFSATQGKKLKGKYRENGQGTERNVYGNARKQIERQILRKRRRTGKER